MGDRIKTIRAGRDQKAFAASYGMNVDTLSRYERDLYPPKIKFLQDLCFQENVDANWLLLGIGEIRPNPELSQSSDAIDGGLLTGALMFLEDELAESGAVVSSEKKADLLLYLYDMGTRAKNEAAFKAEAKRFLRLIS